MPDPAIAVEPVMREPVFSEPAVNNDLREDERARLVHILANRANDEARHEARATLVALLAQRPAAAQPRPHSTVHMDVPPRLPPLPDVVFPAAWLNGDQSLINHPPTSWADVVEIRTAVQTAVVDAWLAEREAATLSVWRQVRIAIALIVIVTLIIGATVLLFTI